MASTLPAPETQPHSAAEPPRANGYAQMGAGFVVAIVTTTVSSQLGGSPTMNLVVALLAVALPPLVTFVGPWRRLRLSVAVAAAAGGLFLTFGGLTLFDAAADEHTVPWSKAKPTPQPTVGPGGGHVQGRAISVTSAVDCTADDCQPDVVVRSIGTEPVEVLTPEITGDETGAFAAGQECAGQELAPDASCTFAVTYTPQTAEPVRATLLVHHSGPGDAPAVALTGSGSAVTGNVRFAAPPQCVRVEGGTLAVTGTVVADGGAGAVAIAVVATDESSLGSGALTAGEPGAVPVDEAAAGTTVRARIDPAGTVTGDDAADNEAPATCAP